MGISLKEEGRELGEAENRKEKSGKLFFFPFLSPWTREMVFSLDFQ